MGKRCKHENADHLKAGDFYDDAADACFGPYEAKCEQFRCLDCGAWLPLGPSRDTPEVCVEIRAAEIAAEVVERSDAIRAKYNTVVSDVGRGWWVHQMDLVEADMVTHLPEAQAGYLARCIVTTEDP